MIEAISHPLIDHDTTARTDAAFRRRPRLTRLEAIMLNELVNASPKPVTARRLATVAFWGQKHFSTDVETVKRTMCSLRAKLGEEARRPTQVVTLHIESKTDGGIPELAYRFVE